MNLVISRDGDAVVVHIPMRLRRRNGRSMIFTEDQTLPVSADQYVADTASGQGA
ncbi:MAG: hypothetical protein JW936_00875 [Sedimentisphaerales bacterium]|nr:hypothetical protein [Sedimentisphaerales bacterium]